MKIAYLIFAYKNPRLIQRTIDRLASKDTAFFIHIDEKSDFREFENIRGENVFFSEQRLPVYWAEFSGVEAILLLMRQALNSGEHYDYFMLLSGSEYPLRSREYIHDFLKANQGAEFMTIFKVPNEAAGKPLSRINTLRPPSTRPVIRFTCRITAKLGLAQRDYRKYFDGLEPYSGLTWWTLTRAACQYVVDYHRTHPGIARFFEDTFAPEESFFHTILGNSPFQSKMRRNLLFEDWSKGGARPAMINESHLEIFERREKLEVDDLNGPGELLFARKFSDADTILLDRIDQMISARAGQMA